MNVLAMIIPLGSDITSHCEGRQSYKSNKVSVKNKKEVLFDPNCSTRLTGALYLQRLPR